MRELDAIGLEILSNALKSINDECFVALMKASYSTNIKERHDEINQEILDNFLLNARAPLNIRGDY